MERDVEDALGMHYWIKPKALKNQKLLLEHIMPSFIICITGLGVSLMIFVVEMVIYKTQEVDLKNTGMYKSTGGMGERVSPRLRESRLLIPSGRR